MAILIERQAVLWLFLSGLSIALADDVRIDYGPAMPLVAGDYATFSCIADYGSDIKWFLGDDELFDGVGDLVTVSYFFSSSHRRQLSLAIKRTHDKQKLRCVGVKNNGDNDITSELELSVEYPPEKIAPSLSELSLFADGSATLKQRILANPRPRIVWVLKDGAWIDDGAVDVSGKFEASVVKAYGECWEASLKIARASPEDICKTYVVRATNNHGVAQYNVSLAMAWKKIVNAGLLSVEEQSGDPQQEEQEEKQNVTTVFSLEVDPQEGDEVVEDEHMNRQQQEHLEQEQDKEPGVFLPFEEISRGRAVEEVLISRNGSPFQVVSSSDQEVKQSVPIFADPFVKELLHSMVQSSEDDMQYSEPAENSEGDVTVMPAPSRALWTRVWGELMLGRPTSTPLPATPEGQLLPTPDASRYDQLCLTPEFALPLVLGALLVLAVINIITFRCALGRCRSPGRKHLKLPPVEDTLPNDRALKDCHKISFITCEGEDRFPVKK